MMIDPGGPISLYMRTWAIWRVQFWEKWTPYEGSWIERKNRIWGLGIGNSGQCPRGRPVGSGKNERMFGVAHFLEKKLKLLDKSKFRPMR